MSIVAAWIGSMIVLAVLMGAATDAEAQFKKGRRFSSGGECLGCHEMEQSDARVKHKPFRDDDCSACHKPHGMVGALRLVETGARLCETCHDPVELGLESANVHEPSDGGDCLACHDPHGSDFAGLLNEEPKTACFTCHDQAPMVRDNLHEPLEDGCGSCHAAHGSDFSSLLVADESELCAQCHELGDDDLVEGHAGYDLSGQLCSGCHDPHSSATEGLLSFTAHGPMADGDCEACHQAPGSGAPGALSVDDGAELCALCHDVDTADVDEPHAPVAEGMCLDCHTPHGSSQLALLRAPAGELCGDCHDVSDQLISPVVHEPFRNDCAACHTAHGES